MDIDKLILLMNNKVTTLVTAKTLAFNAGDLEGLNKIEAELLTTQDTLNKLLLLQTITNAANAANTTPAELISNGIDAAQNRPVTLDNATACMGVYDISSYATDPLHEQKIADILEVMGAMDTPSAIDAYIASESIGSPLTGHMIATSASKYAIDTRLMMALMELDSRFGTAGVAVSTRNPGNVGNTGSATQTYATWDDGVDAVAAWLDHHRVNAVAQVAAQPQPESQAPTQPDSSAPSQTQAQADAAARDAQAAEDAVRAKAEAEAQARAQAQAQADAQAAAQAKADAEAAAASSADSSASTTPDTSPSPDATSSPSTDYDTSSSTPSN